MTTDLHVQTETPSLVALTRLTFVLETANTVEEFVSVITDSDVSEHVLIHAVHKLQELEANSFGEISPQDLNHLIYLILASPACNATVVGVTDDHFYRLPPIIRLALEKDMYLSPAAMDHASADRWHQRDSEYRLMVMAHSCVTGDVVAKYVSDWRVSISRVVAKHKLLTLENAQPLIDSKDAKTRANVASQPWMPVETLHLYRNDPNAVVVRAAKKALVSRSLPESDEIDAVMDDEVSLFFLAASDDEATIKRLGASLNSPEETLRVVAGLGTVGAYAVAGNSNAPASLIESMSIEASEGNGWENGEIMALLAANPQNTSMGLELLAEGARWNSDVTLLILRNPNCTPSIARDKAKQYRARQRIAAIKTGFLTREELDYIITHEFRDGVLRAFVEYKEALVSDLQTCYSRGSERVKGLAAARLVEMNAPLEAPEVLSRPDSDS